MASKGSLFYPIWFLDGANRKMLDICSFFFLWENKMLVLFIFKL